MNTQLTQAQKGEFNEFDNLQELRHT